MLVPPPLRGSEPGCVYTAWLRLRGVEDPGTYLSGLWQFRQEFVSTGRRILIQDGPLPKPAPEEIAQLRRRPCRTPEELIADLAVNLPAFSDREMQTAVRRAYMTVLREEAGREKELRRLVTSAVYLICHIRHDQEALFHGYRPGDVACYILMGPCGDQRDALYLRFLSRLPVDVVQLLPDLNVACALSDPELRESRAGFSLPDVHFPKEGDAVLASTDAFGAQQQLEGMLRESGIYREHRLTRGDALTLRTTCDEIPILWQAALPYRPHFAAAGDGAVMPVLYAQICGVEEGNVSAYWQRLGRLLGSDTRLFRRFPLDQERNHAFASLAQRALRGGQLRRSVLREDRQYPFALLREDMQEMILDKLQLMLDRRLIRGTFERGTEYTVISTILSLDREFIRMLQRFDMTQVNPKVVVVHTGEEPCTV